MALWQYLALAALLLIYFTGLAVDARIKHRQRCERRRRLLDQAQLRWSAQDWYDQPRGKQWL